VHPFSRKGHRLEQPSQKPEKKAAYVDELGSAKKGHRYELHHEPQ
jgi:hypothetical protein